jgi:hypothetical protein
LEYRGHFTRLSSNLTPNPNDMSEIAKKLEVEYTKLRVFKLWRSNYKSNENSKKLSEVFLPLKNREKQLA